MHSFPLIQYESLCDQISSRCQFLSGVRRNFKPQSTARNNLNNGMQISHSARDFRRKANPDCDVFYFANARSSPAALVSLSRKGWSLQLSDKTATLKRLSARRWRQLARICTDGYYREGKVFPLAPGCLGARGSGAGAQPKRIEQNDDTLKGARTMIKRSCCTASMAESDSRQNLLLLCASRLIAGERFKNRLQNPLSILVDRH